MKPILVSAPESGMDWVRFCVEKVCAQRTPGHSLLILKEDQPNAAFEKTHDALGAGTSDQDEEWQDEEWRVRDASNCRGARVAVLVRDPVEVFVIVAKGRLKGMQSYLNNISFYRQIWARDRQVFYYEDVVLDPRMMFLLFDHFRLIPPMGYPGLSINEMAEKWDAFAEENCFLHEAQYIPKPKSKLQKVLARLGVGHVAMSDKKVLKLWCFLRYRMSDREFEILQRYDPPKTIPRPSLWQKITWYFLAPVA